MICHPSLQSSCSFTQSTDEQGKDIYIATIGRPTSTRESPERIQVKICVEIDDGRGQKKQAVAAPPELVGQCTTEEDVDADGRQWKESTNFQGAAKAIGGMTDRKSSAGSRKSSAISQNSKDGKPPTAERHATWIEENALSGETAAAVGKDFDRPGSRASSRRSSRTSDRSYSRSSSASGTHSRTSDRKASPESRHGSVHSSQYSFRHAEGHEGSWAQRSNEQSQSRQSSRASHYSLMNNPNAAAAMSFSGDSCEPEDTAEVPGAGSVSSKNSFHNNVSRSASTEHRRSVEMHARYEEYNHGTAGDSAVDNVNAGVDDERKSSRSSSSSSSSNGEDGTDANFSLSKERGVSNDAEIAGALKEAVIAAVTEAVSSTANDGPIVLEPLMVEDASTGKGSVASSRQSVASTIESRADKTLPSYMTWAPVISPTTATMTVATPQRTGVVAPITSFHTTTTTTTAKQNAYTAEVSSEVAGDRGIRSRSLRIPHDATPDELKMFGEMLSTDAVLDPSASGKWVGYKDETGVSGTATFGPREASPPTPQVATPVARDDLPVIEETPAANLRAPETITTTVMETLTTLTGAKEATYTAPPVSRPTILSEAAATVLRGQPHIAVLAGDADAQYREIATDSRSPHGPTLPTSYLLSPTHKAPKGHRISRMSSKSTNTSHGTSDKSQLAAPEWVCKVIGGYNEVKRTNGSEASISQTQRTRALTDTSRLTRPSFTGSRRILTKPPKRAAWCCC